MAITDDWKLIACHMVENQLLSRGISDPNVLSAFKNIPRHQFIPQRYREWSYKDAPQPIGFGQTISQPYIAALMTQSLHLIGNERVLEVGTGSGYQAAILSGLAREIHTVEYIPRLAERARMILQEYKIENVHVHTGDGSKGLPEFAPFDAIIVTAAAPQTPQPLLNQLKIGGRLVIPVGKKGKQILELWKRDETGFVKEDIVPVAFVPLRGEHGWKTGL
jgi:protein-L-isoaspartate(D-aspartate) O-methyltransferase